MIINAARSEATSKRLLVALLNVSQTSLRSSCPSLFVQSHLIDLLGDGLLALSLGPGGLLLVKLPDLERSDGLEEAGSVVGSGGISELEGEERSDDWKVCIM